MKSISHRSSTQVSRPANVHGFSLVELMVGIAIAMIIFLVISHVFSTFEAQKRVTVTGTDTQSAGMMGVAEFEQSIKSAGAGIVTGGTNGTFSCPPATGATHSIFGAVKTYSYYRKAGPPVTETSPVKGFDTLLAPVFITDGGPTSSDQIDMRLGNAVGGAIATYLMAELKPSSDRISLRRGTGFLDGAVVLIVGGGNCMVAEIIGPVSPDDRKTLYITPAPSGNTWNPDAAYKVSHSWPSFPAVETSVYSPGGITYRSYLVNGSKQLIARDQARGAAALDNPLITDVVSLQAQYGVSNGPCTGATTNETSVTAWCEPTNTWANLDLEKIQRIQAIRIAVVVRSPKLETTDVTAPCVNNAGTNNGPCAWDDTAADKAPKIDLSADPNWRKYRYRVFQTIVPLRNMMWTTQ